ncbi:MAG: hypothetical protein NG747_15885 [Candidatus Brocadia sp.]|nr:hypothetical protein [Candidatus Brocadia sp.]
MHALKIFFKEKWLEIVVIAIFIQLITNAIFAYFGNKPLLIICSATVLLLLTFFVINVYENIKAKKKVIGGGVDFSIKRRGIIFTIGLRSHDINSTVMKVIKKLSPQYCGFIGTEKTLEANVGKTIAQTVDLKKDFYREKSVDPTNIKEIKEDTIHLIQWMVDKGLSKKDIVIDITGGTAIMSVAAYIAADENRIDTQYIYSDFRDNKPMEGSQKALMISKYETG